MDGNPLRAVFVLALIVFALGVASKCAADDQCTLDASERTKNADGTYTLGANYFECLLVEYKAARNLAGQIQDLEAQKALLLSDIERARAHIKLEERATERAHKALELYQATHEEPTILESPVLWFALGVVATSAAVVAFK